MNDVQSKIDRIENAMRQKTKTQEERLDDVLEILTGSRDLPQTEASR